MSWHRHLSEISDAAIANLRRKIGRFGWIMMIVISDSDPRGPHHLFVYRVTGETVEAVRHNLLGCV
jgi:hypothetical protein